MLKKEKEILKRKPRPVCPSRDPLGGGTSDENQNDANIASLVLVSSEDDILSRFIHHETEEDVIEDQRTCTSFVSVLAPPLQEKTNVVNPGHAVSSINITPIPTIQDLAAAVLPPQALPEPCISTSVESMVHLIPIAAQVETENYHVSSEDISVAINNQQRSGRDIDSHSATSTAISSTGASANLDPNMTIQNCINITASMPGICLSLPPTNVLPVGAVSADEIELDLLQSLQVKMLLSESHVTESQENVPQELASSITLETSQQEQPQTPACSEHIKDDIIHPYLPHLHSQLEEAGCIDRLQHVLQNQTQRYSHHGHYPSKISNSLVLRSIKNKECSSCLGPPETTSSGLPTSLESERASVPHSSRYPRPKAITSGTGAKISRSISDTALCRDTSNCKGRLQSSSFLIDQFHFNVKPTDLCGRQISKEIVEKHTDQIHEDVSTPPLIQQDQITLITNTNDNHHHIIDSNDSLHVNVNSGDIEENEDDLAEENVYGGDDVVQVESSSSSSDESADGRGDVGSGTSTPSTPASQNASNANSTTSLFYPTESINLGGKYGNLTILLRPRPPSGHRYVISVNEVISRRRNETRLPSWVPTYAQRIECILHQFMDEMENTCPIVEMGPDLDLIYVRLKGNPPTRLLEFDDSSDSEDSCIRCINTSTKKKKSCLKISREGSVGESRPKNLSWSQHVYIAQIPSNYHENDDQTKTKSCPGIYYMGEFSIRNEVPPKLENMKICKHARRKRAFKFIRKVFHCFRCNSPPPPYVKSTTDIHTLAEETKRKNQTSAKSVSYTSLSVTVACSAYVMGSNKIPKK